MTVDILELAEVVRHVKSQQARGIAEDVEAAAADAQAKQLSLQELSDFMTSACYVDHLSKMVSLRIVVWKAMDVVVIPANSFVGVLVHVCHFYVCVHLA